MPANDFAILRDEHADRERSARPRHSPRQMLWGWRGGAPGEAPVLYSKRGRKNQSAKLDSSNPGGEPCASTRASIDTTEASNFTFVGIPALLIAVSLLALLIPANRAARIMPVIALREG